MIRTNQLPPIAGVVLGITFYEVGNTFQYIIQPVFFPTFFRLLGFLCTLYFIIKSSKQRLSRDVSLWFSILLVWTIIMFLRGSLIGNFAPGTDTSFRGIIQRALLSPYGPFAFFLPFIVYISISNNSLYYLKKLAILLCFISLFTSFTFRTEILNGLTYQGLTSMIGVEGDEVTVRHLIGALYPGFGLILFMLFCFNYIKGKVSYLFPIAIFVFFLSNAIGGGRSQTGLNLSYLLLFFFVIIRYPINRNRKSSFRMLKNISYLLMFCAFVFIIYYLYESTTTFDYVLERAFGNKAMEGDFINDSREILRNDMIKDFNEHPLSWLWGRGVNGAYRTQHLSIGGYRMWMEWGYLYLIIKGGIIYLSLYVYLMLHAAYMGFFRSNNSFSKSLAVMCIVYLLNLVSPGSEPQFSTLFLLSWICFGLLERRQFRMMNDEMIYGYFNVKNFNI